MIIVIAAGLSATCLQAESIATVAELPKHILRGDRATVLDLSRSGIDSPDGLRRLARKYPHLITLDLSGNVLENLSAGIGDFKHLENLNLEGNQLISLPAAIGKLTKLKSLRLSGNALRSLPSELAMLSELKVLFLSNNQFSGYVPDVIGSLTTLEVLALDNNEITTLGRRINEFTPEGQPIGVRVIDVNKKDAFVFGRLSNLQVLDLANNRIEFMPFRTYNRVAGRPLLLSVTLSSLQRLNLKGNRFNEIEIRLINTDLRTVHEWGSKPSVVIETSDQEPASVTDPRKARRHKEYAPSRPRKPQEHPRGEVESGYLPTAPQPTMKEVPKESLPTAPPG